ncbi:nuclear transport factor 2 family protein [Kitasatospora indigofera]|uniref:nuclear transport factor 2 family protein n=1 Tax=Kitasatospora indigofera TaxID=67307 RepID=UPI00364AD219
MNDVTEITQLVLHERQARDRGWWESMDDCFSPGSTVRLSWFRGSGAEFTAGSRRMTGRGHAAVHRLCPPVVDVRGDRALVELPAAVELRTLLDGVQVDLTSYARLVYRVERRLGRWSIRSLDAVYERDVLVPSVPGTGLRVDPADLEGLRPPYRMLAHVFGRLGYQVDDDLYGEDRPEEVAGLHRQVFAWLRGA